MKRFIWSIVLFFTATFIIDRLSGVCFDYLNANVKGGDTANQYHICKQSDEDILIFGSSRANHHYIPSVIEDSLNLSCYNCGCDGNGILLHYGRYKLATERHTPKMIIYDLVTNYDIDRNDNLKYLDKLKQYHDEAGLMELFNDVSPAEQYKLHSKLYQYNTKFIHMLSDYMSPKQEVIKGYKPLYKTMDYEPEDTHSSTKEAEVDILKLKYLEKLITDTQQKGIKLVFMISPTYKTTSSNRFEAAKRIIMKHGIPLFDFYTDKEIGCNKSLFSDSFHMNDKGAHTFTKKIIPILRENLRTPTDQGSYRDTSINSLTAGITME